MTEPIATDCIRFETLSERTDLTDSEVDFCLAHVEKCPLGIHNAPANPAAADAMLKLVETTAVSHAEDYLRFTEDQGIPWLPLSNSTPVNLHEVAYLAPDQAVVEARDFQITDALLKQKPDWLGESVRILRTFSSSRNEYVYQAQGTSLGPSEGSPVLRIHLIDGECRESVATITSKMPRALFRGTANSSDWSSMAILLAAGTSV